MNSIQDNNGANYIAGHITELIFAEISSGQQHRSFHTVIAPSSAPQYKILLLTTRCLITQKSAVMIKLQQNPNIRQVH
jgi:hypothetical protein